MLCQVLSSCVKRSQKEIRGAEKSLKDPEEQKEANMSYREAFEAIGSHLESYEL
jgi:hypothetical protein